jgi:hypothetical protein
VLLNPVLSRIDVACGERVIVQGAELQVKHDGDISMIYVPCSLVNDSRTDTQSVVSRQMKQSETEIKAMDTDTPMDFD